MKERDAQFLALYDEYRVGDFTAFYTFRLRECRTAQRELGYLTAILYLMSAGAGVCASVDLLGHRVVWAVIGAALPVATTALKRYGELFSYRELSQLYSEAAQELIKLSVASPIKDASTTETEVNQYVLSVEEALRKESTDSAQVANSVPRS